MSVDSATVWFTSTTAPGREDSCATDALGLWPGQDQRLSRHVGGVALLNGGLADIDQYPRHHRREQQESRGDLEGVGVAMGQSRFQWRGNSVVCGEVGRGRAGGHR